MDACIYAPASCFYLCCLAEIQRYVSMASKKKTRRFLLASCQEFQGACDRNHDDAVTTIAEPGLLGSSPQKKSGRERSSMTRVDVFALETKTRNGPSK